MIANRGNSLYFVEVQSHWYEGSYFITQNELSPILDINKYWSIFHPLEHRIAAQVIFLKLPGLYF